jgi:hypothetical protein
LNKAHQVKEKFLKNQEILIQKNNPDQFVDVLIKEEKPEIKDEPAEQNVEDNALHDLDEEVKVPKKSTKKKAAKKTSQPNK